MQRGMLKDDKAEAWLKQVGLPSLCVDVDGQGSNFLHFEKFPDNTV